MNNFFEYNNVNGNVELNGPDLLLISEFKALMNDERNKCKEDPTGKQHLRAFKEFTYIYLAIHWQSPYRDDPEQERQAALNSGLLNSSSVIPASFKAYLCRSCSGSSL